MKRAQSFPFVAIALAVDDDDERTEWKLNSRQSTYNFFIFFGLPVIDKMFYRPSQMVSLWFASLTHSLI